VLGIGLVGVDNGVMGSTADVRVNLPIWAGEPVLDMESDGEIDGEEEEERDEMEMTGKRALGLLTMVV